MRLVAAYSENVAPARLLLALTIALTRQLIVAHEVRLPPPPRARSRSRSSRDRLALPLLTRRGRAAGVQVAGGHCVIMPSPFARNQGAVVAACDVRGCMLEAGRRSRAREVHRGLEITMRGVNVDVKNISADLKRSRHADSDCPIRFEKFTLKLLFLKPADVGSVHQYCTGRTEES